MVHQPIVGVGACRDRRLFRFSFISVHTIFNPSGWVFYHSLALDLFGPDLNRDERYQLINISSGL